MNKDDSNKFSGYDEESEIKRFDNISYDESADSDNDDDFGDLNESLSEQVEEQMADDEDEDDNEVPKKTGVFKKIFLSVGCVCLFFVIVIAFLVGTKPGHSILARLAAKFVSSNINNQIDNNQADNNGATGLAVATATPTPDIKDPRYRSEDYVKNYLIFGIEEIDGGMNTDTMMIASLNTKDKSVKLTSVLRDTYVEYPEGNGRKLNSIFVAGRRIEVNDGYIYNDDTGAQLLITYLENLFKIRIDGYAYVGFSRAKNDYNKSDADYNDFANIVDALGGVDIELGKEEAAYLNRTNYIYDPDDRNLVAGWNHLNGDQTAGYCRVRKVVTLGGYNNDFGRTVRQRRVLNAIFDAYKSSSITTILSKTAKCLSYIHTNLNEDQIYDLIKDVIDNGIQEMDQDRVPIEGSYYDAGRNGYNGVTYGLVIDEPEVNPIELFKFIYGDTPEEAYANYNALEGVDYVQYVPETTTTSAASDSSINQ